MLQVIADFGVSRLMGDGGGKTSGSPGTPTYTAPEVWGSGKYDAKAADVWSLGVTLHAMVFGTLPYMIIDPQRLIEAVTAPGEFECDEELKAKATADGMEVEPELLELMHAMIRKPVDSRATLTDVRRQAWVMQELGMRKRTSSVENWEQITVSADELRKAVISGHIENFRRTTDGMLHKTTNRGEADMYKQLGATDAAAFLPELRSVKESLGNQCIIELQDLTFGVADACLMDVKMGQRTFTEDDAGSSELRSDLMQKMLKVDSNAATPEELAAGGISKMRYLQFREQSTTSRTLGFRVDAVQLAEGSPSESRTRNLLLPRRPAC